MNTDRNLSMVLSFNNALNTADLDAMIALMTPDCVFENTYPAPDGERFEGRKAVRTFWVWFFGAPRAAHIEIEEIFGAGERVVMRWRYSYTGEDGKPGHVRGVDVYRVEAGGIAEMLSYVKA